MNLLRGRCRFVSTVSSRAFDYDTFLKDLSNSRVFTELKCLASVDALLLFFSEALDSIPNFSLSAANSKNLF
jgi:hypothetical protein